VPAISIDNGVLERAERSPSSARRSRGVTSGAGHRLRTCGGTARHERRPRGQRVVVDSDGCVVDAGSRLVALVGCRGTSIVVDTPDALLVCPKERAQDVRSSSTSFAAGGSSGTSDAGGEGHPVRAATAAPRRRSATSARRWWHARADPRLLVAMALRFVRMPPEAVERIRTLAAAGTLVYVMRYRSVVDYLLVNAVLLREGLPLARFAPGMSTVWWRPIAQWFRRYGPRSNPRGGGR
jgi:hypothetical protein